MQIKEEKQGDVMIVTIDDQRVPLERTPARGD